MSILKVYKVYKVIEWKYKKNSMKEEKKWYRINELFLGKKE